MKIDMIKKNVNSGKRSRSQSRAKLREKTLPYWETEKSLHQIARLVGCRQPTIKSILLDEFGEEALKNRSSNLLRNQKMGKNNPMYNKCGNAHHNFKGACSDHKGYLTVVKPKWWTGTNKSKRIFEHHLVACNKYGLTHIPREYTVHHLDENPTNNDPNNLLLIEKSAHMKLHAILRRCRDHSERK